MYTSIFRAFYSAVNIWVVDGAVVCKYASRMSSHEYPLSLPLSWSLSGVDETCAPKNHTVFQTSSVMASLRYRSCEHQPASVESNTHQTTRCQKKNSIRTVSMMASAFPWPSLAPLLPCEIEKSTGLPSLTMKNLSRGQQPLTHIPYADTHLNVFLS